MATQPNSLDYRTTTMPVTNYNVYKLWFIARRKTRSTAQNTRTFASVGDVSESYDWRLAYEKRKFGGFDYQIEEGERTPVHNGHNINVFNYDSRLKVYSGFNADIRAGVVDGINEKDIYKNGELRELQS